MSSLFVAISVAGPHWDHTKGARTQPFWDEHAEFIDRLTAEGIIALGGPLVDEGGTMVVVRAADRHEAEAHLRDDPWYTNDILIPPTIKRWEIFVNTLAHPGS